MTHDAPADQTSGGPPDTVPEPNTDAGMPSARSPKTGTIRPQPRPWSRFVAIGDSFTEGMSDADPQAEDAYIGWADRLASLLSSHVDEFQYANLAVRGRKLAAIAGEQTQAALALRPDLVSLVGGGNDILRPRADLDALGRQLEAAVIRLRAAGADVLLSTPSDPSEAPVIQRYRGRMATYTAHVWKIAERHDCYVLNQWSFDFLKDWRMWADDRIHMTTEGHRRVALAAYTALGHEAADADWQVPLPQPAQTGRMDMIRSNVIWAREYGGPWVQRRVQGRSTGDNVLPKRPELEPLNSEKGGS
ncbi:MAG: SGNH/GDSL hydrolase family protein [Ornithinimicrobium sp.]